MIDKAQRRDAPRDVAGAAEAFAPLSRLAQAAGVFVAQHDRSGARFEARAGVTAFEAQQAVATALRDARVAGPLSVELVHPRLPRGFSVAVVTRNGKARVEPFAFVADQRQTVKSALQLIAKHAPRFGQGELRFLLTHPKLDAPLHAFSDGSVFPASVAPNRLAATAALARTLEVPVRLGAVDSPLQVMPDGRVSAASLATALDALDELGVDSVVLRNEGAVLSGADRKTLVLPKAGSLDDQRRAALGLAQKTGLTVVLAANGQRITPSWRP